MFAFASEKNGRRRSHPKSSEDCMPFAIASEGAPEFSAAYASDLNPALLSEAEVTVVVPVGAAAGQVFQSAAVSTTGAEYRYDSGFK